MTAVLSAEAALLMLLMLGLGVLALGVLAEAPAADIPSLDQVRLRPHAVEKHGEDALEARARVFRCSVENLRVRICPETTNHGLSVYFWCQEPGAVICPGMITTIGGVEKTAFMKPCAAWEVCQ